MLLDPTGVPVASVSMTALRMPSGPNSSLRAKRSASLAAPPAASWIIRDSST